MHDRPLLQHLSRPGGRRLASGRRAFAGPLLSGFLVVLAAFVLGCAGGQGTDVATSAGATTTLPPTPAPSLRTPEPGASWPAAWSEAICEAWTQLHRPDAAGGGTPGSDAATRAIEVMKKAGAWPPGSTLRSALARDAFVLFDAAPRGGQALVEREETLRAADTAYVALNAATGFSCPE